MVKFIFNTGDKKKFEYSVGMSLKIVNFYRTAERARVQILIITIGTTRYKDLFLWDTEGRYNEPL